jgi:hypothetical protein
MNSTLAVTLLNEELAPLLMPSIVGDHLIDIGSWLG